MSKEIVPVGSFAALTPAEDGMAIQDIVNINMAGGQLDPSMLDRVKVPSGGSLSWEVPGLDGEPEPTKEIVGVIVGVQNIRAYFATKYEGGNEPPECSSRNGINGEPASDTAEGYGGRCSECQMSAWGSGENGGQACAQRKLLFVLQPESALPIVVNVPPSSLKEVDRYLLRLTSKRTPFFKVVSKLKLKKVQSKGGIEYAQIAPGFERMLDDEEAASAGGMYQSLHALFSQVAETEATEGF